MMPQPKLSVVIPTYNRRDALFRTLQSLFHQNYPQTDYEIVVVVDGSMDGTLEMLATLQGPCPLKVLHQENRGLAAARNLGWKAAVGDLVLFLDDDMLCDGSLIQHHVAAHSGLKPIVVLGPTPFAAESPWSVLTPYLQSETEYDLERQSTQTEVAFPDGIGVSSNTSLRRSVLKSVGGFDERFIGWGPEDIELGVRLLALGISFQNEPRAVAHHLFVKSPDTSVQNQFWCGRNSVLLAHTHLCLRPFTLLTPLENGSYLTFRARQLAIKWGAISVPLSARLFACLSYFARSVPILRRCATFLYGVQCRIQFLRGAIEEAGSAKAYRAEFGAMLPILWYDLSERSSGLNSIVKRAPLGKIPAHLKWLARKGFRGITLADWQLWRTKAIPLPTRPVVLAFDGMRGYVGECVLPLLEKFGLRGTLIVDTNELEVAGSMDVAQMRRWADKGHGFSLAALANDGQLFDDALLQDSLTKRRDFLESLVGSRVSTFAHRASTSNRGFIISISKSFDLGIGAEPGINELGTPAALLKTISVGTNEIITLGSSQITVHVPINSSGQCPVWLTIAEPGLVFDDNESTEPRDRSFHGYGGSPYNAAELRSPPRQRPAIFLAGYGLKLHARYFTDMLVQSSRAPL